MGKSNSNTCRVNRKEAARLFSEQPLGDLMRRAHGIRTKMHPEGLATYVFDTNPNYTNICVTRCSFCAFCRDPDNHDAYVHSPEELAEIVKASAEAGATTVLLQGGHNPDVRLKDWKAYIRAMREACPNMHIHPFSPSEIVFMARAEGVPFSEILKSLKREGIDTMPGGGAEVLTDRVRSQICPNKITSGEWFDVMEKAHELGFKTTATMMFGHIETDDEILEHLFSLRDIQDRTGGFSSFVPWSFKPGGSPLSETVARAVNPAKYLRVIAISRIVLDNFPHIQSSWFSENVNAGQLGLLAGADDFGGLLVEENVLRETGFSPRTTQKQILSIIRKAGFTPARRDSYYNIIERHAA